MVGRLHRAALQLFRRLPVKARRRVVRTIAPAYTVGSICVIERADGAVLLVRLSYRNSWGLPGGLLKRGETPEAAARREVKEVDPDRAAASSPEIVEVRWFPTDALPDLQHEASGALMALARRRVMPDVD